MRVFVLSILTIAFMAQSARSQDWDSRYLVMSLSLGEIDPDRSRNSLLFMSLYFDLEEDVQLLFPPRVEPVYAEISTIIVAGNAAGEVNPDDPLYGSRMETEQYRRGDPGFEALLIGYNPIAPWYDLRVDTPHLSLFQLRVNTSVSPFDGAADEVLSRNPWNFRSPTGSYDIQGTVRTDHYGSSGLHFDVRPGEPLPEIFMYNIGFADAVPLDVCAADVNRDGAINFFDVLAFIDSYQLGCP